MTAPLYQTLSNQFEEDMMALRLTYRQLADIEQQQLGRLHEGRLLLLKQFFQREAASVMSAVNRAFNHERGMNEGDVESLRLQVGVTHSADMHMIGAMAWCVRLIGCCLSMKSHGCCYLQRTGKPKSCGMPALYGYPRRSCFLILV